MLVTMIFVASCQMKTKTVPYDPIAAKAEVSKALDSINMAAKARDNKTFISFFTEDGLFCGTDPKELWTKEDYAKLVEKMLADTTMHFDMKVDKKEIRVEKDGNSAITLEQFITRWSKPITLRSTMHFVKVDNKWMVDFSNIAFIPDNKDIPKITAAVK